LRLKCQNHDIKSNNYNHNKNYTDNYATNNYKKKVILSHNYVNYDQSRS